MGLFPNEKQQERELVRLDEGDGSFETLFWVGLGEGRK